MAKVVAASLKKMSAPSASRIISPELSKVMSPVEFKVRVPVGVISRLPSEVMLSPLTAKVPARVMESSRLMVTVSVAESTVVILVPPAMVKVFPWVMAWPPPESPAAVKSVPETWATGIVPVELITSVPLTLRTESQPDPTLIAYSVAPPAEVKAPIFKP